MAKMEPREGQGQENAAFEIIFFFGVCEMKHLRL